MKSLLIFLILSFCASALAAETEMTDDETYQKWLTYATPGPEHKMISQMAGTWTYESKWSPRPGAEVFSFKGTVKRRMILQGRFLLSEGKHKTPWKDPYLDHGLFGYNNLAKRYEAFSADNKGTGMRFSFGEYNPETKTFILRGAGTDYAARNHDMDYRVEMKLIDKDTISTLIYQEGRDNGKDFKTVETLLKRKK